MGHTCVKTYAPTTRVTCIFRGCPRAFLCLFFLQLRSLLSENSLSNKQGTTQHLVSCCVCWCLLLVYLWPGTSALDFLSSSHQRLVYDEIPFFFLPTLCVSHCGGLYKIKFKIPLFLVDRLRLHSFLGSFYLTNHSRLGKNFLLLEEIRRRV